MTSCRVCQAPGVALLLDCKSQPICNRFLTDPSNEEYMHELVVGQCETCGVVQLISGPVPAEELRPRYDWVTYREPEEHLDRLADTLSQLPGITKSSTVCGVSFKDDPLLERLTARGFSRVWRMDPESDLGIRGRGAGVETVQDRLDAARAVELGRRHGRPDLVVARHILEHAHDVRKFTNALRTLVSDNGVLVLEVPDCTRTLDMCDYTTLWEEHILYFTPETFRAYCEWSGLALLHVEVFPYAMENSIVGIGRFHEGVQPARAPEGVSRNEQVRAQAFAQRFSAQRDRWQRWFAEYRRTRGKIALFGAGHLSCTFINLHGLRDHIEFVVDDHSNKRGLFMPGSRLPIRGSDALLTHDIRLCLLGLSPEGEERVIQRQEPFLQRGGDVASIVLTSKRALSV